MAGDDIGFRELLAAFAAQLPASFLSSALPHAVAHQVSGNDLGFLAVSFADSLALMFICHLSSPF